MNDWSVYETTGRVDGSRASRGAQLELRRARHRPRNSGTTARGHARARGSPHEHKRIAAPRARPHAPSEEWERIAAGVRAPQHGPRRRSPDAFEDDGDDEPKTESKLEGSGWDERKSDYESHARPEPIDQRVKSLLTRQRLLAPGHATKHRKQEGPRSVK